MGKTQKNKGVGAVGGSKGQPSLSSSALLSASIVNKFKIEFEKDGILIMTPKLEAKLKKCIADAQKEIQSSNSSSSMTEDVGDNDSSSSASEEAAQSAVPPASLEVTQTPSRAKGASTAAGTGLTEDAAAREIRLAKVRSDKAKRDKMRNSGRKVHRRGTGTVALRTIIRG